MFSRRDRYRDTLFAGLAMLAMAALLAPLIPWLGKGLIAAGHDLDTIENPRSQGDIAFYGVYLYAGMSLLGVAVLALTVLGLWLIIGGGVKARRRRAR